MGNFLKILKFGLTAAKIKPAAAAVLSSLYCVTMVACFGVDSGLQRLEARPAVEPMLVQRAAAPVGALPSSGTLDIVPETESVGLKSPLALTFTTLEAPVLTSAAGQLPAADASTEDTTPAAGNNTPVPPPQELPANDAPPVGDLAEKISQYRKVNADVIGFLQVPNTNILHPVLQGDDVNYYLDRDIYKQQSRNGVIWADPEVTAGSNNIVLYGHNWTNYSANPAIGRATDLMFAQLTAFQHLSFAQSVPYFYYADDDGTHVCQIFAAFYADVDFAYNYCNLNAADLEYIIDGARERSEHDYDVDVSGSDTLVTLSTCTRRFGASNEQRFVVMAKIVGAGSAVTITSNPSPLRPAV